MYRIVPLILLLLLYEIQAKGGRKFCPSSCRCGENKIDCSQKNFTKVLRDVLNYNRTIRVTRLHLEDCHIKNQLPKEFLRKFPYLRHLRLSDNRLKKVPDLTHLRDLDTLLLSGNDIKRFKSSAFSGPRKLKVLQLERNGIEHIPSSALYRLKRLQSLSLKSNRIRKVKCGSLYGLRSLLELSLQSNQIKKVNRRAFHGLFSLQSLKLNNNNIKMLKDDCFAGLFSLNSLNLKDNRLTEFPVNPLKDVKRVSTLNLGNNRISKIPPHAFDGFGRLKALDIWNQHHLEEIAHTAFRNMRSLTKLKIECNNGATKLTEFPDLTGTLNLRELDLTYCDLENMPANFCANRTHLFTLNLMMNKIPKLANMQGCKNLKFLDLQHNRLELLDNALKDVKSLIDLDASHNHIKEIGENDFFGLRKVDKLDLSHNLIEHIHLKAFESFRNLKELSMAHNKLKSFPTAGLEALTHINTRGNPDMLDFPSHGRLPNIRKLVLHYPYHCCYYRSKEVSEEDSIVTKELSSWVFQWEKWGDENGTDDDWPTIAPGTNSNGQVEPLLINTLNHTDISHHIGGNDVPDDDLVIVPHVLKADDNAPMALLECQPEPNVFYPCDNLMSKQWLRICVWIVFLLALIGNSVVLFVIFANYSKCDVQRFLTLNLAFADLLLGIYLGFLAVVDIMTAGNFRAKALEWQFSSQCQAAGFIAVLSSELSVYTLLVITIERFITIKYSMYINKQMTVSKAVVIMIFGWIFCMVLAILPILRFNTENGTFHFSDYTKYSICLPFDIPEKSTPGYMPSVIYLSFVLLFNIFAFTLIVFCYIKIFLSVRGSGAFNSGDSRVAKRVALLVFTDFACWFPICILALTAVYGSPLIKDLWLTKVFTVFIFPLNACANPFLYAIFTKQFHRDCWTMYRQIKHSDIGLMDRLNKKMKRGNWKMSSNYQAFRRGSSCSFHIGRRCSTRGDELRMSSRSTYRTPMNTDDERERDRDDREERREPVEERETCL